MATLGVAAAQDLIQTAKGQASIDKISRSAGKLKLEKSAQAAKDFEAVFISEMIKPMFDMIEVDDTFGGGKGEEVFRGMMVQEYGKMISDQGGIGLASHIQAELLKYQEDPATAIAGKPNDLPDTGGQ